MRYYGPTTCDVCDARMVSRGRETSARAPWGKRFDVCGDACRQKIESGGFDPGNPYCKAPSCFVVAFSPSPGEPRP